MQNKVNHSIKTYYLNHKGLIINLFATLTFIGIDTSLGNRSLTKVEASLAMIYIIAYLAEPWATYYSMGVYNERRIKAGLEISFLQRWMRNGVLTLIFWAGRFAILGVLFSICVQSLAIPDFFQHKTFAIPVFMAMMVREGYIVYFMTTQTPLPNFKESYDFLADIILVIVLAFGQLAVKDVFRDFGIKNLSGMSEIIQYAFPIILFLFTFYLPLRYIYSLEELTFAQTKWQKIEGIIGIIVVLLGFLFSL